MTRTKMVVAAAVVVCMLLICIFLPEVVSVGWHFLHGSSVNFLVWEVPVPWDWRELKGNNLIVIQKVGRWNKPPSDVIVTALDLPGESAIGHEQWKKASLEAELKRGHHFISESEVHLDGEAGFCLAFSSDEQPDRRWTDCDFPIHRLSIGYIGTKDNSQILNLIIPNIRASK